MLPWRRWPRPSGCASERCMSLAWLLAPCLLAYMLLPPLAYKLLVCTAELVSDLQRA